MTTHMCPPIGGTKCPCCGKTPLDLPLTDRMTAHGDMVTCRKPRRETLLGVPGAVEPPPEAYP